MRPFYAYLEDFHEITVIVPHHVRKEPAKYFEVHGNDEIITLEIVSEESIGNEHKYITRFDGFILLNQTYHVKDDRGLSCELYTGKIVRTELFDDIYYYDGNDLGVTYTPTQTTFKIWTPVAKRIDVILTSPEGKETTHQLRYKRIGVWVLDLEGDYEGYTYHFTSYVNGKTHQFTDPYAVASTANGEKSVIIDPEKCVEMPSEKPTFSGRLSDAIIYETSIRDLTMDPSINAKNKGRYLGFIESGLKTKDDREAGFDYLKSLGVTHLQIHPFFDFEGVDEKHPEKTYNWGYNPSQYNVPEGSYTSDPDDAYARLNELRTMIDTLHKNGLRVVMDVVYNHVYNVKTFPFEKIIPGYAFRVDKQGILTNSSGCENDLATERKMVRKFIIDSVLYWAKTFKVDGFRFDLMGLIDVKTMNMLRQKLELYHPDILVYGEGWHIPAALPANQLAHMTNKNVLYNIGFFNDKTREHIKGATFNPKQKGYAMGNTHHLPIIKQLLLGSVLHKFLFKYPSQSINYVECHDNHTFYDKAAIALKDEEEMTRLKRQKLATSIILLSQGVPFIHMGQEFYRSKNGVENSYKSPDTINQINWDLVDKHHHDIEDFKKLVTIRKTSACLKLPTTSHIKKHAYVQSGENGTLIMEVCRDHKHTIIIFKNNPQEETLTFDVPFDIIYSSTRQTGDTISAVKLNDISTTVLSKHKKETDQ